MMSMLDTGSTVIEPAETEALHAETAELMEAGTDASAPFAVTANAAIIIFREGLEAVLIMAALLASMVGANRVFRRPLLLGAAVALAATGLTWWLAEQLLATLSSYGERLSAVVSLIAVAMLLLVTNWFFHRVWWKDWMAGFHARKRVLLGATAAGQMLGFVLLGFSSLYREGFEVVLFLQALTLQSGVWAVLQGVVLGLAGVVAVGIGTFYMQRRLPYKRMLMVTGVLISGVLVVMVGHTAHILQEVGWLAEHGLPGVALPAWLGTWLGVYATWEGLLLQLLAALTVVGSYVLAERLQRRRRQQILRQRGSLLGDVASPRQAVAVPLSTGGEHLPDEDRRGGHRR